MELHLTAAECHLPYEITQCYLPPDTSEHSSIHSAATPAREGTDRLVLTRQARFSYPRGTEGWVDPVYESWCSSLQETPSCSGKVLGYAFTEQAQFVCVWARKFVSGEQRKIWMQLLMFMLLCISWNNSCYNGGCREYYVLTKSNGSLPPGIWLSPAG